MIFNERKPNTGSKFCPHVCTCGSACYIGAIDHLCINPLCDHYDENTLVKFQREYMKSERDKAADLFDDDEPTQPRIASMTDDIWTKYVTAWAPMLGVDPLPNESTEQLRDRILEKLGYKPGSRMIPVVTAID